MLNHAFLIIAHDSPELLKKNNQQCKSTKSLCIYSS